MKLLPTYKELENIKAQLATLHWEYDKAIKADKPFAHTRQIFDAIKKAERELEKIKSNLPNKFIMLKGKKRVRNNATCTIRV